MPQAVVPIVKSIATFFAANAVTQFVGQVLLTVAISTVTSRLFGKKAPKTSFAGTSVTTRSSLEYHKIIYGEAVVSGPIFYNAVSGTDNERLHYFIAMAGHEVDSFRSFYLDADEIPLANVTWTPSNGSNPGTGTGAVTLSGYQKGGSPTLYIRYYNGESNQPADASAVSALSQWTTNHQAQGICYAIFELINNEDAAEQWEAGAPRNYKARIRGRRLYDPRLDSTNGGSGAHRFTDSLTWEWSDNPALCAADYLVNYMGAAPDTDINWPSIVSAADHCEDTVFVPDGTGGSTTEQRFTCNGVVTTGSSHKENLESIVSSMNGRITWSGGQWKIFSSQWQAPSVSFNADDLIGDLQVRGSAPRAERFNTIEGFFVNPDQNYQPVEFQPITISTYLTRDNNEELNRELELPMTNSDYMCQRIAIGLLRQGDDQIVVRTALNARGLKCQVGDTVALSIEEMSWVDRTFRVVEWKPRQEFGYDVILKEDSESAYDAPASTDYRIPIDSNSVVQNSPFVPAPTSLSVIGDSLQHRISWDANASGGTIFTEVWYADTNDRSTAVRHATVAADQLGRVIDQELSQFYWVRNADLFNRRSEWFPVSATGGVSVTGGGGGGAGTPGSSGATVDIFIRTDDGVNPPALPTTTAVYDFTTGIVSNLNNGWTQGIQSSGGQYQWRSRVNIASTNPTFNISPGNWLAPGINSADGNDGVTSIPSFTPGLIGGSSNLVFQANRISEASANDGEVLVLGTRFAHPDGTERSVITNRYMATPLEGATTGRLYGMYTEVAPEVRFGPGDYGNSLSFVPVRYESGQWQIVPNTAAPFNFTPIATDCLVCIIEKTDIASSGIDRVISLLGGLQGETGTDGTNGTNGTNGTDGTNGQDGFTITTIRAYKRQSTVPTDDPGGGTYTVETGAITLLNGWSAKVPPGDPFENVYFVELDINTNQATQTYLDTDWTAPDVEISAPAKSYGVNLINGNPDTPANSDGTGYDLSLLSGRFQVLENGVEVNGLATFSVVGDALKNGLTFSIDADGDWVFSGGNWTSNGEVFTTQADYDGLTFTAAVNVTKKLSGAPGASPPVQVMVSSVGDFAPPPDTAVATYTLTDTGVEQKTEGTTTTVIGNWLVAGSVGDYECELLVNSGTTPTGSPTGSRIGLAGGRSWTLTDNTGGLPVTNNVTIRIFNATTSELLATRSFPMSAEQGF